MDEERKPQEEPEEGCNPSEEPEEGRDPTLELEEEHEPSPEAEGPVQVKLLLIGGKWRIHVNGKTLPVSVCESMLNELKELAENRNQDVIFWQVAAFAFASAAAVLLMLLLSR